MRFFRLAIIVLAMAAVPLTHALAESDPDNHLSPEQRAAKKNAAVNAAYEETIRNTAPLTKVTPNNDPWSKMRNPSTDSVRR